MINALGEPIDVCNEWHLNKARDTTLSGHQWKKLLNSLTTRKRERYREREREREILMSFKTKFGPWDNGYHFFYYHAHMRPIKWIKGVEIKIETCMI